MRDGSDIATDQVRRFGDDGAEDDEDLSTLASDDAALDDTGEDDESAEARAARDARRRDFDGPV